MNIAGIPGTAPADLVVAVNTLAVRHLTEVFLPRLRPAGTVTIVSSTAGFGWPERLEAIRDLLATDTFEEGAAWFKAHPQQGNAYNFSKETTTVYTMMMGLALAQMGFRIKACCPGPSRPRSSSTSRNRWARTLSTESSNCSDDMPPPATSPRPCCFWRPTRRAGSTATR
jgi:NAD(P)-dependent dehydrogenase (short-subunit alcohol dehydrogenase family)